MTMIKKFSIVLAFTLAGCFGSDKTPVGWIDHKGDLCQIQARAAGCSVYHDGNTFFIAEWADDANYDPNLQPAWHTYYDPHLRAEFQGWGWLGENGIFYEAPSGIAINETQPAETSRDIVRNIGLKKNKAFREIGSKIAAQYGLSQSTGIRVARTLIGWNRIAKSRERTRDDVEALTKNLFGVELARIERAFMHANSDLQEQLIQESATHLSTSPENMRTIIRKLINE